MTDNQPEWDPCPNCEHDGTPCSTCGGTGRIFIRDGAIFEIDDLINPWRLSEKKPVKFGGHVNYSQPQAIFVHGDGITVKSRAPIPAMIVHRDEFIMPDATAMPEQLYEHARSITKEKIAALREELATIKSSPYPDTANRAQQIERILWLWSMSFAGTDKWRRIARRHLRKEGIDGWWLR